MKKKESLIVILLLFSLLVFVSCGDEGKKNDQNGEPTATSSNEEVSGTQFDDSNWLGWDTTED